MHEYRVALISELIHIFSGLFLWFDSSLRTSHLRTYFSYEKHVICIMLSKATDMKYVTMTILLEFLYGTW